MNAIQIECKLKRKGGTLVPMRNGEGESDTFYHFTPDQNDMHSCMVGNPDHVARFLAIPEAYALLMGQAVAPQSAAIPVLGAPAPVATVPITGQPQTLAEPVVPPVTDATTSGTGATETTTASDAPYDNAEALAAWADLSAENMNALRTMHLNEIGTVARENAKSLTIAGKLIAKRFPNA